MPLYRKKPLEFEAICLAQDTTLHYRDGREGRGRRGDWLVVSPLNGDQYIVDADDFPQLAEAVNEAGAEALLRVGLQR